MQWTEQKNYGDWSVIESHSCQILPPGDEAESQSMESESSLPSITLSPKLQSPSLGSINADRARQLESMIEKGDWEGVATAGNLYRHQDSILEQSGSQLSSYHTASTKSEFLSARSHLTSKSQCITAISCSDSASENIIDNIIDARPKKEYELEVVEMKSDLNLDDSTGAHIATAWAISRSLGTLLKELDVAPDVKEVSKIEAVADIAKEEFSTDEV